MKVDHIGIVVADLDAALRTYAVICPGVIPQDEPVADGSMRMAILHLDNIKLELMEPLQADSPTGKFLDKHGEGLHHIAYKTNNIEDSLQSVAENGIRLIDKEARIGAEGLFIAFLHPKDTFSVLTEFCQDPS